MDVRNKASRSPTVTARQESAEQVEKPRIVDINHRSLGIGSKGEEEHIQSNGDNVRTQESSKTTSAWCMMGPAA